MTARITSQQSGRIGKHASDAASGFTKDNAQRVIEHPDFPARLKALMFELATAFYILLSDEEAVAWIVKYAKKAKTEARQIVNGLRQQARTRGIADSVKLHAEVQAGCLFKRDIPRMGPCWEDFKYLQNWNFQDPATEHALVSWIPVPLAGSAGKYVPEQTTLVAAFRTKAGLPAWYDLSFGSVNHVGGLSLAHFNATKSDPFANLVVRTDTCCAGSYLLGLNWGRGRLSCAYWGWVGYSYSRLAVFVVGVVKALGR